jgi:LacI family transcriptional regulator
MIVTLSTTKMETPSGHLTLKDLAREAGVSVATLDRVLHGRAGVRAETARRVREAIERHGGNASGEVDSFRGRVCKLAFVMPTGDNVFMRMIVDQVALMSNWLAARRATVETIRTDVFNPLALAQTLDSLAGRYEGVAVVALDHQSVRAAIDDLVANGTQVVTLVSDVPGSKRSHYVGIDNVAAGRTAGTLIGRLLGPRSGAVGVIAGSLALRDHAERIFGFHQVLNLEHGHLSILNPVEGGDQDGLNESIMSRLLTGHPDLIGVYNVGAGVPGVAKAITDFGRESSLVFIAHDLNDFTRRALLRGMIDAVISQDPGHEARSAIRVLLSLARGERLLPEQEKIRIEIVMRDNLP